MKTFFVQTLGCKVNQYESEQVAALLRSRGLEQTRRGDADLRIVNTCSVTVQAASQSRQSVRQMIRRIPEGASREHPSLSSLSESPVQPRVVVIGCWATSDKAEAAAIEGVDAVLTHQDDLAAELDRLLTLWQQQGLRQAAHACDTATPARPTKDNGWMLKAGTAPDNRTTLNRSKSVENVNRFVGDAGTRGRGDAETNDAPTFASPRPRVPASLPLLGDHQNGRQRAFLKVQDGCDAHCTYCIIPRLRTTLWSKPIENAVEEASHLVAAGHVELVLTGIFLGAYGQPTALRRRQHGADALPLAQLVDALCRKVTGLRRLRLSSLEPGDLNDDLLATLAAHPQVVPHFHLPLQSGSDLILRRMNRQYRQRDFLAMLDRVTARFDRPALTTDIIVGFPAETDQEFERTLEVVERARFIHIHAFPFSPRPGTAAARWTGQYVHGSVVNQRIDELRRRAQQFSHSYRSQFVGEEVEVITERDRDKHGEAGVVVPAMPPPAVVAAASHSAGEGTGGTGMPARELAFRTGRCERYFAVHFEAPDARPGDLVRVRISRVTPTRTFGEVVR